jgi:hypothetical protein
MSKLKSSDLPISKCCGRKPLVYLRKQMLFCSRCDREYDLKTGEQIPNWAWKRNSDGTFASLAAHTDVRREYQPD